MTIGIFGDSFGDWNTNNGAMIETSWPYLVAQRLEARCVNMAQGGASLYYSYKSFLERAKECETVIFLLTNPGRYTIPFHFEKALPNRSHINGIGTVEYWLTRKEITREEKEKLTDLRGFYLSLDFEWEHTACNLLVDEIKKVRPDAILIPCFNFYKERLNNNSNVSLQDIMDLQIKSLGCNMNTLDFIGKYAENKIACHYTKESNEIVANAVIDSIAKKKWTFELPNHIEHANPLDYYYAKR